MIELVIKRLRKNDLQDINALIERLDKSLAGVQNVNLFLDEKKKTDPEYMNE